MTDPTCVFCVSPGMRAIARCYACGTSATVCEGCYASCTPSDVQQEARTWGAEHRCRVRDGRHVDALRQSRQFFLELLMGANPTAPVCRRAIGLIDAALEET